MSEKYTQTPNFLFKKFTLSVRGWGGDNNGNWDVLDSQLALSKRADWITQGVFDSALLPVAGAGAKGVIKIGENLTLSVDTVSVTGQNVVDALGFTPMNAGLLNEPLGVPQLDGAGKILQSQLPKSSSVETYLVLNEADKLALDAQQGDIVRVLSSQKTYVLSFSAPTLPDAWVLIASPEFVDQAHVEANLTGEIASHVHDLRYAAKDHHHDDDYVKIGGNLIAELFAQGELSQAVALPGEEAPTLDYNVFSGAKLINRIRVSSISPPEVDGVAPKVEVDILAQTAPGVAPVSLFPDGDFPFITGNGGLNWVDAELQNPIPIADNSAILLRVVTCDPGFDNVLIEVFE